MTHASLQFCTLLSRQRLQCSCTLSWYKFVPPNGAGL